MSSGNSSQRIGFIGAGKMATALVRGFVAAGAVDAPYVVAHDVSADAQRTFADATGARVVADNAAVLAECETIFLAVKPQAVESLLGELKSRWTPQQLLISIVAGTPIATLSRLTDGRCRVVRVMPNTPCLVSAGASAFAAGPTATVADAERVQQLLATVGVAVPVAESLLDAVTGLSGSGPAYAFQIIEALSDGGVRMGLPRGVATQLAAQTLFGAARMVLETGEHPAALKDAVTSPGGTTIAGLHALESGGLRAALIDAVVAATKRSQELGAK